MTTSSFSSFSRFSSGMRKLAVAIGMTVGLAVASPAFAVLGGAPMTPPSGATVNGAVGHTAAPVASMALASSPAAASAYTVRSTTLVSGTTVNEYLNADNVVFGIAWQGPRFPDMPTMLGAYFPQYVQGIKNQRSNGGGRGPVSVTGGSLVVRSGGHMGAFAGQAYLPQSLPSGVAASDIK